MNHEILSHKELVCRRQVAGSQEDWREFRVLRVVDVAEVVLELHKQLGSKSMSRMVLVGESWPQRRMDFLDKTC